MRGSTCQLLFAVLLLVAPGHAGADAEIRLKDWPLSEEDLERCFYRVIAPRDPAKIMRDLVSEAGDNFRFASKVIALRGSRNSSARLRCAVLGGKGSTTYHLVLEKDDLTPDLVDAARAKVRELKARQQEVARIGPQDRLPYGAVEPLIENDSKFDRRLVIQLLSSPVEENVAMGLSAISQMAFASGGMFSNSRSFEWTPWYRKQVITALASIVSRSDGQSKIAHDAMERLSEIGPGANTEAVLASALGHQDQRIRYRAALTLAKWKKVQYVEQIFEALKDSSRYEKAAVMEAFCNLRCATKSIGSLKDGSLRTTIKYDRKTARLFNAVLNAARANPMFLEAMPYVWGNVVDELRFTARSWEAKLVAHELSDNLFFFKRTEFEGKRDPQPLHQRRLLPVHWVPTMVRHGSSGAPETVAELEQLHRKYAPAKSQPSAQCPQAARGKLSWLFGLGDRAKRAGAGVLRALRGRRKAELPPREAARSNGARPGIKGLIRRWTERWRRR